MEVLFHMFHSFWRRENRSLHRGLLYIEVRYIEVAPYSSLGLTITGRLD